MRWSFDWNLLCLIMDNIIKTITSAPYIMSDVIPGCSDSQYQRQPLTQHSQLLDWLIGIRFLKWTQWNLLEAPKRILSRRQYLLKEMEDCPGGWLPQYDKRCTVADGVERLYNIWSKVQRIYAVKGRWYLVSRPRDIWCKGQRIYCVKAKGYML